MNKQQLEEKVVYALRMTLPSKRLNEVVSNLAVINPINNNIIKLKTRPGYENVPIEEYEFFNEHRDITNDYSDLFGKSVLIDDSILSKHRAEAIFKLHAGQL